MNVTFYKSATSNSDLDIDLISMLDTIKKGKYQNYVEQLAQIQDPKERRSFKSFKVPAFTASGTFAAKDAKSLKKHSGVIAIDFDGIDSPEALDDARAELYADPYTLAGFLSISQKGLCILVKIDGKKHREHFKALDAYYWKKYRLQLDQSCINVNRLRLVSSDPDLFLNLDAKTFTQLPPEQPKEVKNYKPIIASHKDFESALEQIQAKRIDLTQDYHVWIAIGQAIYAELGESGLDAFQSISQHHPEYDPKQTERKYRSFKGTRQKTIATFYYYAKQHGIQIVSPQTKAIALVAKTAKKQRSTQQSAIETLQAVEGIPPEQSAEIVKQVFETDNAELPDDDDDIDQIKEYIRLNCPIQFNEITLKYQYIATKKDINDRELNTIYLNCKQIVPKASKDLVQSIIFSNFTPAINPVKTFFDQYAPKHTTTGHIQALADTIRTNTKTDPNYKYMFIRKWLIGAVAMWYKHHSPLMLILAGSTQNTGKTQWFRRILPQQLQPYWSESEITGKNNDEHILMCSKIMMFNDEMSGKSKQDIAKLKKLTSTQWFNVRLPYGRMWEDLRRIAAFCGTSNDLQLISDPTGNRRLVPIEVLAIDHNAYNAIDKTALWCEVYHAYQSGEEWNLTKSDIKMLNDNTEMFEEPSLEGELIQKYYSPGTENNHELFYSNSEIKVAIEENTRQKLSPKKIGMELKRLGFEQTIRYHNGKAKRGYFLQKNSDLSVMSVSASDAPF